MELANLGSLDQVLEKYKPLTMAQRVKRWGLDIVSGLHYLHDQITTPVIHRDIKPQNVLVFSEHDSILFSTCKLADFGLAVTTRQEQGHRQIDKYFVGTATSLCFQDLLKWLDRNRLAQLCGWRQNCSKAHHIPKRPICMSRLY